jgi:hypothetical protein
MADFSNTVGARQRADWWPRVALLALATLAAVGMIVAGDLLLDRDLLFKYPPDWSWAGWIRKAVTALVGILFFLALRPAPEFKRQAMPDGRDQWLTVAAILIMAFVLLGSAFTVLFIPENIGGYVREGKPLSVLTEVAFAFALIYLARAALAAGNLSSPRFLGAPPKALLWAGFAVVLLVLMEEMSWGQHWIGWQAGELFAANEQSETNLHNFATHRFEAVYYTLAFMLFVVLPWVWPRNPHTLIAPLTVFVPPRAFAIAGVALAGLWYNDWNIVPYQIWFFLGLLIALQLFGELAGHWKSLTAAMIALVAGTQVIFLIFGADIGDGHELSEVREFLIAILVAVHAVLVCDRIKRQMIRPKT